MKPDRAIKITDFEADVYKALEQIPAGRVATYHEVAKAIGRPRAVRAVGNALHKNPFAPEIPCHRVVYSDGKVGNYAKGANEKIRLLRSEGVEVSGVRVKDFERILYHF